MPGKQERPDLDGSLVQGELGGFDAYAREAALGTIVTPPSWAHKLIVYHRGVGMVEKRGYFIGAKCEELLTRCTRSLASAIRTGISRRVPAPVTDLLSRMAARKDSLWATEKDTQSGLLGLY